MKSEYLIVHKGTGYIVGSLKDGKISIDCSMFGDQILNAELVSEDKFSKKIEDKCWLEKSLPEVRKALDELPDSMKRALENDRLFSEMCKKYDVY